MPFIRRRFRRLVFDAKENGERLEKFFRFIVPYMEEHPPQVAVGGRE